MKRINLAWLVFLLIGFEAIHAQAQKSFQELIQQIKPSVVTITTFNKKGKKRSTGFGFFIRSNQIISSRQIFEGAHQGEVKLSKGEVYSIQGVIAEDIEADIIQLLVDIPKGSKKMESLRLSKSFPQKSMNVIIYNPLVSEEPNKEWQISTVRDVPGFGKIMRITGSIPSGSIGSPVVNQEGEVIGVVASQKVRVKTFNFIIPEERISSLKPSNTRTLEEWTSEKGKKWLSTEEGLYFSGLVYLQADNFKKALSSFEKAIKKK
ncbi:trypsin-like peptidase domain-containing protein [candidate division TA06 bacterium]|nr:trypsin-like peptidase domain-containing protein [candidate division TA06 bacterium]